MAGESVSWLRLGGVGSIPEAERYRWGTVLRHTPASGDDRLLVCLRDADHAYAWVPLVAASGKGEVRLSEAGVTPGGAAGADLTSAIQAVIDANPGKWIVFDRPDGIYHTGKLTIPDDTTLVGYGATLFHDGTGLSGAILTNASTPGRNIAVIGLTLKTTSTDQAIYLTQVDGLVLHDVRVLDVVSNWATRFEACSNVRITGYVQDAGTTTGEDGLHFIGGSNIVIADANIKSGDDCVSFTFGDSDLGNTDLENVVVSNCVLESRAARLIAVNIASDTTSRVMRRLRFSNISGVAGSASVHETSGISFMDATGTNRIDDVALMGVTVDCSAIGTTSTQRGCYVLGVDGFTATDVLVLSPVTYGFEIDSATNVRLVACESREPRGANSVGFYAHDSTNVRYIGCTSVNPLSHHFQLGATSGPVTGAALIDCRSEASTGVGQGVRLHNASGCRVIGGYFDTGGSGIIEASPSDYNEIYCNDVRNIANTNYVVLAGTHSIKAFNLGDTPSAYTASNVTTDRSFDADTVAVAELADVVGTLISDLRAQGMVG